MDVSTSFEKNGDLINHKEAEISSSISYFTNISDTKESPLSGKGKSEVSGAVRKTEGQTTRETEGVLREGERDRDRDRERERKI